MKSLETESEPDAELELSLSQLPIEPSRPAIPSPSLHRPRDEAGPSRPVKQPRVERRWHGNLQSDARALVILLQTGCVEPGTREVTFEGIFEGLNEDQFYRVNRPVEGSVGHQRWLEGPVNPLTKAQRADYIASTIKRILTFLQME